MYFITKANIITSQLFWENLSDSSQKKLCHFLARIYNSKISRFAIPFFCKRYSISQNLLQKYKPASGKNDFQSFQDFFTRKLAIPLKTNGSMSWPCEGYVCESGKFSDLNLVNIKGNLIKATKIFGKFHQDILAESSFFNIFLHNHNYHRFHSPVDAEVLDIEAISGKLLFLRPWFYQKNQVSFPSFLNERVIIKLKDSNQLVWHLCFVAGMGVGNIELHKNISIGNQIKMGDEIGLFLLGSTCCMSVPYLVAPKNYMAQVEVGAAI